MKRALMGTAALCALLLPFGSRAPADGGERIVVTGTRMAGSTLVDTPVEALPDSSRSLADILQQVPGVSVESPGTSVDLRGLDPGRTLVLLNGRRFVPSQGAGTQVPAGLVDRVEVLSGGASAVYGRDAVAGVVNFITRDDFEGIDLEGSWTLPRFLAPLSRLWIATEHSDECDAGDGVVRDFSSFFPRHDWGGPLVKDKLWFFGSQSQGFPELGYGYRKALDFTPEVTDFGDRASMRRTGFRSLADLLDRVEGDPAIGDGARSVFFTSLYTVLAFGGPWLVSDFAAAMGGFAPDDILQALRDYTANPPAQPAKPPRPTRSVDAPALGGDGAAPLPEPFAGFPYPPPYLLDDPNDCPEEVKKKARQLMRERDQARADMAYYMDYLRREGQSAVDAAEDARKADEARKLRDSKNEELKTLLRGCVPGTASTDETESQSSTSRSFDPPRSWRLDLGLSYRRWGLDESFTSEPAEGALVCLHSHNYGAQFGLPGESSAFRDVESGASESGDRKVLDARGRATFDLGRHGIDFFAPSEFELDETAPGEGAFDWESLAPRIGFQYQLGVNWPLRTLRVNGYLDKPEGVVQQFAGGAGDVGSAVDAPEGFRLKADWSVGANRYLSWLYPQYSGLDPKDLGSVPGVTNLENDTCGDSALPPDGLGYVSQAASPVQSVEDQWALERIGVTPELSAGGGEPIVVGIIDTGLDWNHLDLAWDSLWRNADEVPGNGVDDDGNGFVDDVIGWNFVNNDNKPWDDDGHGTFVAGLIAATHGNGAGIDGVDPHAKIMVLKALNTFGRTRASYVAQAIVYGVDNGARILNVSVASRDVPGVVIDALAYARSKGVLVVAAAGNRAETVGGGAPGGGGVLAVAATGPDDRRAPFSNVGPAVRLAAPGVDLVSLRARRTDFMRNSARTAYSAEDAYLGDDRRYYRSTGTSFSAPLVSGVASLVWSRRPQLTVGQVQRILEQSARDVETPGVDLFTGYGIVDARAALAADPEFFVDAGIADVRRVEENGQVLVEVRGSANADQFGRAWLEVGRGEDPTSWVVVGEDALPAAVRGGVLGRIPASRFDGAKVWTVRLLTEHVNGRVREARYVVELG